MKVTDQYDEPMLLTTSLDRQEVLVLTDYHREEKRKALVLVRTAERDHHARRLTLFSDALLELDPMEPDA